MANPYDFQNVVAIKMLIKRGDAILLVREPEHNEWMPGRLGLPGGKPLLGESLREAMRRKIDTEVGLAINVTGIVAIMNIKMPQKTVYHIVVAADYVSGEIGDKPVESDDISWYSAEQVTGLGKDDFTEYYNNDVINEYFRGSMTIVPLELIHDQDNRTAEILGWMNRGSR